jgi:uncharacterized protein (DUF362 family)
LKLQEMGASSITVGDRSGMGDTRRVMKQLGVFSLAKELGFATLIFDDLPAGDWAMIQPPGSHWKSGFQFARPCLEFGALVQTCCLKTHRFGGGFTMSLKNSVGMVAKYDPQTDYNYMTELHGSPDQRKMIAEINTAYQPALVVLDGMEAFVTQGPDTGQRVSPEVVLAGTDRIAIDVLGLAILKDFGEKVGATPVQGAIFQQDQIARAIELGLGVDSPEKIEIITSDSASAAYAETLKAIL